MDQHRTIAGIIAQGVAYGSPADSEKGARQKQQTWTKFINTLDWNKLKRRQTNKKSATNVERTLTGFGIPVNNTKKGDD